MQPGFLLREALGREEPHPERGTRRWRKGVSERSRRWPGSPAYLGLLHWSRDPRAFRPHQALCLVFPLKPLKIRAPCSDAPALPSHPSSCKRQEESLLFLKHRNGRISGGADNLTQCQQEPSLSSDSGRRRRGRRFLLWSHLSLGSDPCSRALPSGMNLDSLNLCLLICETGT